MASWIPPSGLSSSAFLEEVPSPWAPFPSLAILFIEELGCNQPLKSLHNDRGVTNSLNLSIMGSYSLLCGEKMGCNWPSSWRSVIAEMRVSRWTRTSLWCWDAELTGQKSLDEVKLGTAAQVRAGSYSGGMKRRLSVATALIGDPKLVFLDEPVCICSNSLHTRAHLHLCNLS